MVAVTMLIGAVSLINLAFGRHGWLASVLGFADGWTLGGVLPGFFAVVAGLAWFAWRTAAYTAAQVRARERTEEEERVVAAIGVGASWDLDLDRVYARFANDLPQLVGYDRLTFTMSRPDGRVEVVFTRGGGTDRALTGTLIAPGAPEPDGLTQPEAGRFRSRLVTPFRGPEQLSGHLVLRSKTGHAYGDREAGLLRQVVAHVSLAVINAHLFQQTLHRVRERTALAEIG
ncbi:MAG: hypothetical protein FJ313_07520, partial [Gemmatimonadetes bacterium]|nr:hypothetical protein [Gemmatimonadota bacterium]